MTGAVILGVSVVLFWVLAFLSGRRFGVLGLALAAGAFLSHAWSGQLIGVLERADVTLASLSMAGVVSISLVLLPALVLLFSGPSYHKKQSRMISATLFAVFAGTLIVEPLSSALVLNEAGRLIFDSIVQYQTYIVSVGIVLAVLDLLAVHTVGGHRQAKAKH